MLSGPSSTDHQTRKHLVQCPSVLREAEALRREELTLGSPGRGRKSVWTCRGSVAAPRSLGEPEVATRPLFLPLSPTLQQDTLLYPSKDPVPSSTGAPSIFMELLRVKRQAKPNLHWPFRRRQKAGSPGAQVPQVPQAPKGCSAFAQSNSGVSSLCGQVSHGHKR